MSPTLSSLSPASRLATLRGPLLLWPLLPALPWRRREASSPHGVRRSAAAALRALTNGVLHLLWPRRLQPRSLVRAAWQGPAFLRPGFVPPVGLLDEPAPWAVDDGPAGIVVGAPMAPTAPTAPIAPTAGDGAEVAPVLAAASAASAATTALPLAVLLREHYRPGHDRRPPWLRQLWAWL